jgi:hypothetical protein
MPKRRRSTGQMLVEVDRCGEPQDAIRGCVAPMVAGRRFRDNCCGYGDLGSGVDRLDQRVADFSVFFRERGDRSGVKDNTAVLHKRSPAARLLAELGFLRSISSRSTSIPKRRISRRSAADTNAESLASLPAAFLNSSSNARSTVTEILVFGIAADSSMTQSYAPYLAGPLPRHCRQTAVAVASFARCSSPSSVPVSSPQHMR